jgi:hypothetical protein
MRRKSTIISQTEQIRQAIHYGFPGLVLFDDDESNPQITTTNDRQSFSDEWERLSTDKGKSIQIPIKSILFFSSIHSEREKFLNGISNEDDHQISVLILSYSDVQNIFASVPSVANKWLPCPLQWHNKTTSLKLGGSLEQIKLRLVTFMQEVPVHLPVVLSYIRGTTDADHFVMIGYQLGRKQQEKIINEIIRAYEIQINNGWHPRFVFSFTKNQNYILFFRRSIIFCAWSGLSYDHYPSNEKND